MRLPCDLSLPADSSEISLYIHIPYCTKKCPYCHFFVLPNREEDHKDYTDTLLREIALYLEDHSSATLKSVYFGGGTPSLLHPRFIEQILSKISNTFSIDEAEITLEGNPESLIPNYLEELLETGINRLSIGIQSLKDYELQLLGREHSSNTALEAVKEAYKQGFSNITIDLMYDLPKQTSNSWEYTLKSIQDLPITHLSLYNLVIEPQTLFYKNKDQLKKVLPEGEVSTQMLERAVEDLSLMGLDRYEISAFCREGSHSIHNTGYWRGRNYLGFGPSAHSCINNRRYSNFAHYKKWKNSIEKSKPPIESEDPLSDEARRIELFLIHLRLVCGVNIQAFEEQRGTLNKETLSGLDKFAQKGWIEKTKTHYFLSKKGQHFYDQIASDLVII